MCFAIDDRSSFEDLDELYEEFLEQSPEARVMLIGCKSDLDSQRTVTYQEATEKAIELGNLPYIECSAKNAYNIYEIFDQFIDLL